MNTSCPKKHQAYKLPATKAIGKSPNWSFFTKVDALHWSFSSFKLHYQVTSKKIAKDSTLKNDYNSILDTLISQKLVPLSLVSYIDSLKECKKRKPLNQSQVPQSHQTAGSSTASVINISNGKNQTNYVHINKRRKLRDSIEQMKKNTIEAEEEEEQEEEEQGEKEQEEEDDKEEEEQQDEEDLDDSFESIDKHPKATHYYNYFTGNGQTEWSTINTVTPKYDENEDQLSRIIQDYREESLKEAKCLQNISDCRILSLSFIFPFFSYDLNYSFTNSIKKHHGFIRSFLKPFKITSTPDEAILWCNRLDSAFDFDNDTEFKIEMKKMKQAMIEMESEPTITTLAIIERVYKEIRLWNNNNTEDDFMAYLYYFTDEIFAFSKCPDLSVKKTLKHLSTDATLKPDLKISYEYKQGIEFDMFIAEVKKNSNSHAPNKSDFVKINLEMKMMLNKLIKNNVDDPVAFGLLVQGHECLLLKMTLESDGFYFSPVIRRFHLPRDVSDISLVPKVTAIFLRIRQELDKVVKNIQSKKKGKSPLLSLSRPSYDMPKLINDPLQHLLNND